MCDKDNDLVYFAKIVMVGDCGVGKTSLLRAFCDADFSPSYLSTIGVDFRVVRVAVGDMNMKLHIWDTAGQERYKSLTVSYFRGALGVLICYDTSKPIAEQIKGIRTWHEIVQHCADCNAKIVLVGNKLDQSYQYDGVDEHNEAEMIAHELGIPCVLTSSRDNINVRVPFEDLIANLAKEDLLKQSTMANGTIGQLSIKTKTDETSFSGIELPLDAPHPCVPAKKGKLGKGTAGFSCACTAC